MKVFIGKYKPYYNVYNIVDRLQKIGVSEERCEAISDWLVDHTPAQTILDWINEHNKRKEKIRIDRWDKWSADHTLSLIIHPLLIEISKDKTGCPMVDLEDVPEHLRYIKGTDSGDNEWDKQSLFWMQERWQWVIGEMIFAHGCIIDDNDGMQFHHGDSDIIWEEAGIKDGEMTYTIRHKPDYWYDKEGHDKHQKRIDNGLRLFGKYYRTLWT